MAAWVEGRVTGRRQWTRNLISLQVSAPEVTFVAGQFGRLALPAPEGHNEPMIGRPYSFVNPPLVQPHEFYFIVVPEGPLTPRLAALAAGDPIWMAPRASGFFSIGELPEAEALWCLSTGTGIGPFLSMLRTDEAWTRFPRIVLVHGVRHPPHSRLPHPPPRRRRPPPQRPGMLPSPAKPRGRLIWQT